MFRYPGPQPTSTRIASHSSSRDSATSGFRNDLPVHRYPFPRHRPRERPRRRRRHRFRELPRYLDPAHARIGLLVERAATEIKVLRHGAPGATVTLADGSRRSTHSPCTRRAGCCSDCPGCRLASRRRPARRRGRCLGSVGRTSRDRRWGSRMCRSRCTRFGNWWEGRRARGGSKVGGKRREAWFEGFSLGRDAVGKRGCEVP